MLVREYAYNHDYKNTVVHALDEDSNPLCGINMDAIAPWIPEREGVESEVTCEACREEMNGNEEEDD